LRNQDYDLRLRRSSDESTVTLETFADSYALLYHRDPSLAGGQLDAFLDRWSTLGLRLDAETVAKKNAVRYGVAFLREALNEDATTPGGIGTAASLPNIRNDRRAFASDTFSPARRVSLSLGATLATSDGDPALRFDPRASAAYRPSSHDSLSVSVGRSTQEPSLQTGRVDLLPTGALNPDCGALAHATKAGRANVTIGSGPATNLVAESSLDSELEYARTFGRDTFTRITLYDTALRNRIVTADLPAGTQLPQASLAPILARIDRFCGFSPLPGAIDFTLSRAFNAATARARGIELSGRARLATRLALDYAYDVQSIVVNDLPNAVLATDPTLVNGAQAFEIPLHKATLGIEYTTRGGLDVRLDGHAVSANNPQQLTAFAYADASLSQIVSARLSLNVAIANVFDSHAQTYGLVGLGVPYTTNTYGATLAAPFVQPFNERYGLQPAAITLSAALHL
jgi:outer membrane receptor for ferrienterochelin and colicin